MKNIAKFFSLIVTCAGLWIPAPAVAQSCSTVLNGINNWFLNGGGGPYGVSYLAVTLISNRADGGYVSYAEGSYGETGLLAYYGARQIGAYTYPSYVQGSLNQYFSDRRYQPANMNPQFAWAPFNPGSVDSLGVRIFLEDGPAFGIKQGEVVLTLNSWGGGSTTFQSQCNEGMLYGSVPWQPTNAWTMFVISMNKKFFPGL
jgi:hypothetical protein